MYFASSRQTPLTQWDEVTKTNPRALEVVTLSVVVEKIRSTQYDSIRNNEFMGWKQYIYKI